jgi:hypothetical protein
LQIVNCKMKNEDREEWEREGGGNKNPKKK